MHGIMAKLSTTRDPISMEFQECNKVIVPFARCERSSCMAAFSRPDYNGNTGGA